MAVEGVGQGKGLGISIRIRIRIRIISIIHRRAQDQERRWRGCRSIIDRNMGVGSRRGVQGRVEIIIGRDRRIIVGEERTERAAE